MEVDVAFRLAICPAAEKKKRRERQEKTSNEKDPLL